MKLLVRNGILYESILATYCNGKTYAAPVGFIKNENLIEIKVYKGTRLHEVISKCLKVTLNFTHDPELFVKLAFKEEFAVDDSEMNELFTVVNDLPRLRRCIGYIVAEKVSIRQLDEYDVVQFREVECRVCENPVIEPFTRCYAQLIEAAIHSSRVKFLEDREAKLRSLKKLSDLAEVIRKTCNTEYRELMKKLEVLTKQWLEE
ncbi:MAG: DUF447 family protein [Desulfurococcaceae archaeon]